MPDPSNDPRERPPAMIEATFRNGSLTAISVILGFSLSFLVRWSALPGPWTGLDLLSVGLISLGILLQIASVAVMLFTSSLITATYNRAIAFFLAGLTFVALGTGLVIVGDITDTGTRAVLPSESANPPIAGVGMIGAKQGTGPFQHAHQPAGSRPRSLSSFSPTPVRDRDKA